MKNKKLKPFIIGLGTYKYDVMVCIASDPSEIAKTLMKYGINENECEGLSQYTRN